MDIPRSFAVREMEVPSCPWRTWFFQARDIATVDLEASSRSIQGEQVCQ